MTLPSKGLFTIISKQEILEKWNQRARPENMLWGCQAKINYEVIKNNTPQKAISILKEDYEKHKEMGIAHFILEAIEDVKSIEMEVRIE